MSLFLICVVIITFCPVFHAAYMLNFDDNMHLFYNSQVRDKDWRNTPLAIFFTPDNANGTYVPLTILTFFYENALFGLKPWVSHSINLLLHLAVCGMAFLFGRTLGLSRIAVFAGVMLFAVHPLHVEPVAWVTARKDLLYSFFYLSSMVFYLRYIDAGRGRDYIFALLTAALSIFSKPMALSLPLVLFLLDLYRGRSFSWKLMVEKIPFFCVVWPLAFITYTMNAREAHFSWYFSPFLWVWCAAFYIRKFFWPTDLAAVYKVESPISTSNPEYYLAFLILFVVLILLWFWRKNRLAVFAVGFYVCSLFFIWRFDIFDLTFVGDRFMYLPSLGICFLLGIISEKLVKTNYRWGLALLVALLCVLMVASYQRASVWKNSYSLWTENFKHYKTPFVLNAYGEALLEENCFKDSREDFIKKLSSAVNTTPEKFKEVFALSLKAKVDAARRLVALKRFYGVLLINPNSDDTIDNIGYLYIILKNYSRAITFLNRSIELSQGRSSNYYYHRGLAYEHLGNMDLALKDYDRAIAIGGVGVDVSLLNRANIMFQKGNYDSALSDVIKVIEAMPEYVRAYELAIKIANAKGSVELAENFRKLQSFYLRTSYIAGLSLVQPFSPRR
ncbi:MAG: tetratricopeptide repeat protein [Candidatus Omnitrophica bacterium]|nr:tetratricopeptide repeat protein [Candidatus Omnitrophota bacterium]